VYLPEMSEMVLLNSLIYPLRNSVGEVALVAAVPFVLNSEMRLLTSLVCFVGLSEVLKVERMPPGSLFETRTGSMLY
jgi:hypothetical protein